MNNKFYLTIPEISEILEIERPELKEEFEKKADSVKEFACKKVMEKIENLGINPRRGEGELTFPLPFQKELTLDIKIAFAIEVAYVALNKEDTEITKAKLGIVAESDKTASATYNNQNNCSFKNSPFRSLVALENIKKYISNSRRIR